HRRRHGRCYHLREGIICFNSIRKTRVWGLTPHPCLSIIPFDGYPVVGAVACPARGYPGISLGDSGGASPSPTPNKSKSVPLEAAHHNYSFFIFHSSLFWRYLMSYQEEYRQKLTTAEEAVKVVKSGDWVDYG